MRFSRSTSLFIGALALVGESVPSRAEPIPYVTFRASGLNAQGPRLAEERVAFIANSADLYTWDLIRPPVLASTHDGARLQLAISSSAATWYELGQAGIALMARDFDGPGVNVTVWQGSSLNFDNHAIDGRCVAFSVFDANFTMSIYRACIAGGALVSRVEIDGNLVRANGNPISLNNGPYAYGHDVAWTAGSFDPFVTAPLLYAANTRTLTRLITSPDTDYMVRGLNADSVFVLPSSGFPSPPRFARYNRSTRTIKELIAPTESAFWGGFASMNENSDIAFDLDLGRGDDQRLNIARPGKPLLTLASNTHDHALGEGVVLYSFFGRPRVRDLDTGYDVQLSAGQAVPGTLAADGRRVGWIDNSNTVFIALPADDAVDALIAAVRATTMPALVKLTMVAALQVARIAIPRHDVAARVALVTFEALLANAVSRGWVTAAQAGPLAAASAAIRAPLAASEAGSCSNGVDDDHDGLRDCRDPDCAGDGRCREAFACRDGIDNDLNGRIDCADPDCALQSECTESDAECGNGLDDDGDGAADCDDSDCDGRIGCSEIFCFDGVDDDADGLIDCDDPDCEGNYACREQACADGADNDDDGAFDCDDSDCAYDGACFEQACGDGVDNDDDGAFDCDDVDCSASLDCAEQGALQCSDSADNDLDGSVDCGDGECLFSLACTSADIDLGSSVPHTVGGDLATGDDVLTAPCGNAFGPELTYRFTAPAAGTYAFDTFGSAIDTILTASGDTKLACNDDAGVLQSQVVLTLAAGESALVTVHAWGGIDAGSEFVLTVSVP